MPDIVPDYHVAANPQMNVVAFELQTPGGLEKCTSQASTRADDCIRQAWAAVANQRGCDPLCVTRIYSEWEPSASDKRFIAETFTAPLTFTFERPGSGDWDQALRAAQTTIKQAEGPRGDRDAIPAHEFAGKKGHIKFLIFTALFCVGAIAVGIWQFDELGEFEARGGSMHINAVIATIYEISGRYGVLVFFLLVALCSAGLFFSALLRSPQASKRPP